MKRPSLITFFIGHPVVALLLLAATAFMLYVWWTQTATNNSIPPLLAGGVVWMVYNAFSEVSSYKAWERRWAAAGGGDPDAFTGKGSFSWMRLPLAIAVWAGGAYWLVRHEYLRGNSDYENIKLAWIVVTGLAACCWLYRVIRWIAVRSRKRIATRSDAAANSYVVTTCMGVPKTSPAVYQTIGAMPERHQALLSRPPNINKS